MSLLSSLFKTKKTPDYGGQKPATSLNNVQGGPEYYQQVLARSRGENVGYGPDYATYANPQIASLNNQFTNYQLPELKSELSAQGRREGSGGFDQIRRAYQENGLQVNDILGQLLQRNADVSHSDKLLGSQQLGDWNQREANTLNNRANFDRAEYGQRVANLNNDFQSNQESSMRIGQGAVALGGIPFTGGQSLLMFPSYSPSATGFGSQGLGQMTNEQLLSLLQRNAKTANIGQTGYYK